jgi:hypothetical protein
MLQSFGQTSFTARRWRRICLAILCALVLIIAAVQIVFSTDLPRNLLIAEVQKETGLRVTAGSVSTGFFSRTTLDDLALALPTSDKAFLTVPVLKLDHTWLLGLLIGDSLKVHVVSIDHLHLDIIENSEGKWNVQKAAEFLSRGNDKPSKPSAGNPDLPAVEITHAEIVITDNQRRSVTLENVNVKGMPSGADNWQCRVEVPDHLDLNAQVAPGGSWAHEVDFDIRNVRSLIDQWNDPYPVPSVIQGKWSGRVESGRLVGQLTISKTQMQTLSGKVGGNASVDLANPYQSRLDLSWQDLVPSDLRSSVHALRSMSGSVSGSLQIQPATDPHPLEPLAINLQLRSNGVQFSEYKIGDLLANGFFSRDRFVLRDTREHPTQFTFAGNVVHFWGRLTRHSDGIYQSLLELNLQNAQLDTILPAGSKIAKTPGLLSGQITIIGRPQDPELSSGQGALTLEKTDLAGTGPIAFLYNLMHVGHDANKPTGSGSVNFTIQNKNIYLSSLRYFDKGTEVRLSGEIDDISRLPHSRVSIIAVGSIRPLASIHIPGLSDFDDALATIQHSAFAIKITGYLDKPTEKAIPFAEVGNEMKSLLFGDATATQ